jgi:hypothetical protein
VTGLLIDGAIVPVAGLTVIPPASHGGPIWSALHPEDFRARTTTWIRQIIVHTTGGHWPQPVLPGSGPGGHAQQIAEMWQGADRGGGDRVHSAAQLIVDTDGTVVCLCDLATTVAYHAEGSNAWSVGIEMCTRPDGSIYGATLTATAKLVDALCYPTFPIPRQMPRGPYRNAPLRRMELGTGAARHNSGGPNCVGVFGHRDNTSERGRGDPGDTIWTELSALGFEGLDYNGAEDLHVGELRQSALNARGESLTIDGIVGPASLAASARQGFAR